MAESAFKALHQLGRATDFTLTGRWPKRGAAEPATDPGYGLVLSTFPPFLRAGAIRRAVESETCNLDFEERARLFRHVQPTPEQTTYTWVHRSSIAQRSIDTTSDAQNEAQGSGSAQGNTHVKSRTSSAQGSGSGSGSAQGSGSGPRDVKERGARGAKSSTASRVQGNAFDRDI
ncbi:hypothetical protein OC835_007907, partial [Tilletia horrida]